MSALATPTSKLEAVSSMLATIGERPVNTLTDTDRLDVVRAVNTLEEINRIIQIRGWWFNNEEDITMAVTGAGEVLIPTNALKIDEHMRGTSNLWVYRGDAGVPKLYDKKTRSFSSFAGKEVKLDIVFCIDFEDLPEAARLAIFRRAGVTFQMRTIASQVLEAFTEREASQSWAILVEAELDALDNTLTESDGIFQAVHRR